MTSASGGSVRPRRRVDSAARTRPSNGIVTIESAAETSAMRPAVGVDEAAGDGGADQDEGEFPSRSQHHRDIARRRGGRSEQSGQRKERGGLDEHECGHDREDQRRARPRQGKIEFGADGNEEQPQQQSLERLDRHLDLAAIFGFRQQQPGDERAERHREPARRGDQGGPEHDQHTGGHEEFDVLRHGDRVKQRSQHQTPEHDDDADRERGGRDGQREPDREIALPGGASAW